MVTATAPLRTLALGFSFPEGPRWRGDRLWFSDIHGHRVLRLTADGAVEEVVRLDDRPSGLGFLPSGALLISSILDRTVLAVRDGAVGRHADLSHLCAGFINDMVVDRLGRAYVGARNGGLYGSATDSLILVTPDGGCRVAAHSVTTPNGAAVTADGRHLILAETALGQLTRFRLHADGSLGAREVFGRREGHVIDGICLDAEGAAWCAGGTGGSVFRLSPSGEVTDEIVTPGRSPLAVALGGPDGRTLFVATTGPALHDNILRVGADRTLDASVNSDGRIEAARVSIPGIEAP